MIEEVRARADPRLRRGRREGDRGRGAREVAVLDLGEDASAQRRVRAALRHHGVPHRRADQGGVLRGAGRGALGVSGDRRPLQGLHLDAEVERLSEPAHRRDAARAAQPEDRDPDPHRRDEQHRGERRRRALGLQGAGQEDRQARSAAFPLGAGPAGDPGEFRGAGRVPGEHQAGTLPGPGVLLHAEGAADPVAARRDAGGLRLRGALARSATPASARRSTAGCCRCGISCRTATRSRS